jgi:cell division protein FtsA
VVTVVDIGSTKVVAIAAEIGENQKIEIHGLVTVDCRGVRKGAIVDLDAASRSIDAALRHLAQDIGKSEITEVALVISGPQIEGSSVQGFKPIIPKNRAITNQDVMEVVNHSKSGIFPPDRVQIQTIPREFRVDEVRSISKPVGKSGAKLEVVSYMITGLSNHVNNFEEAVRMTGREVDQLIYGPLASGLGVLGQSDLDKGTIVVDMGASKTDISIFVNGAMAYAACIPVGGSNVTSDLSQLLNCDADEAERLKIGYGSAFAEGISEKEAIEVHQLGQPTARPMQRKVLCEIIESRMKEVAKLIRQTVEKSGYGGVLEGGVILTGGATQLPRSKELVAAAMNGMTVRVVEPNVKNGKPQIGLAAAIGATSFLLQTSEDLSPIAKSDSWQDRAKGLWSMFSGKN